LPHTVPFCLALLLLLQNRALLQAIAIARKRRRKRGEHTSLPLCRHTPLLYFYCPFYMFSCLRKEGGERKRDRLCLPAEEEEASCRTWEEEILEDLLHLP